MDKLPDSNGNFNCRSYPLNDYAAQKTTINSRLWLTNTQQPTTSCWCAKKAKCHVVDPLYCQVQLAVFVDRPVVNGFSWGWVTTKHTYDAICPLCATPKQVFYTANFGLYANELAFSGGYGGVVIDVPCVYNPNQLWED